MFCTKCGQELNEGIKFCTKCGNQVKISSVKNIKAMISLISGILAFVHTSFVFIVYNLDSPIPKYNTTKFQLNFKFFLGFTPQILFIVIGITLGFISYRKRKTIYARIGIILCYLSIALICLVRIIYFE
jgi:magnesium-transporting ATPase (P-type)